MRSWEYQIVEVYTNIRGECNITIEICDLSTETISHKPAANGTLESIFYNLGVDGWELVGCMDNSSAEASTSYADAFEYEPISLPSVRVWRIEHQTGPIATRYIFKREKFSRSREIIIVVIDDIVQRVVPSDLGINLAGLSFEKAVNFLAVAEAEPLDHHVHVQSVNKDGSIVAKEIHYRYKMF